MHPFQLSGLAHEPFEHLFLLSDEELTRLGVVRMRATKTPGFPCRVSLCDAEVGEEVILLAYPHQPATSPYRSSGPIFIRRNARRRVLGTGELPAYVTQRQISVRGYDSSDMMVAASICDGQVVAAEIDSFFGNSEVEYIHLHNAKRGCYSCAVSRA